MVRAYRGAAGFLLCGAPFSRPIGAQCLMSEYMQNELARLLDDYDARRRVDLEREQKTKEEAELFLTRFAEVRRTVIRPVFEAAGAMLEARGHRFSITEQEFVGAGEGRGSEAGIALRVTRAGTKAPLHDDQRSLAITTRHYNRTVWINSGDAPNADLTPRRFEPGGCVSSHPRCNRRGVRRAI